jgi:hypothetical protein
MQPSTPVGNRTRLALLPLSWVIAVATAAVVLMIAAIIQDSTIRELLQMRTLWPLAIILPALALGKVLGLILMNVVAYFTPLRRVFDQECSDSGRHDFASATLGLTRVALVLLALTVAGVTVFVLFAR